MKNIEKIVVSEETREQAKEIGFVKDKVLIADKLNEIIDVLNKLTNPNDNNSKNN